jgi:hypothetical protein
MMRRECKAEQGEQREETFGRGFTFLGTEVESPQHLPIWYLPSEKDRGT